ncbi:MAG: DUF3810 domain-containing protein [Lachnospiraceae bacterium]|nr:DUF3810 domain-containing protein [Lachnospiraceae bacterium]
MSKRSILFKVILICLAAIELLLSIFIKGFSDFYAAHVFPIWNALYARVWGLFKGLSVGELLIYLALVYVLFTVVLWIIRLVNLFRRSDAFKTLNSVNTNVFLNIVAVVILLQVQNCFVLYHVTPLFEGTAAESYVENRKDLIALREMLAKKANELSVKFERNDKGEIVYETDIKGYSVITMQHLGEAARDRVKAGNPAALDNKIKLLSGYYSQPKPLIKSDFFCQQSICGYYFPFSLEANYNKLMYVTNFPNTMCHELAHTKGFILEDEANFIAYLACLNSGNDLYIYSATIEALSYVNVEVRRELAVEPEERAKLTPISELVSFDSMFITEETRQAVEADAWFKTEKVKKASDAFIDTNLTINGVEDGIQSYSRMVDLLLKYYYGGVY